MKEPDYYMSERYWWVYPIAIAIMIAIVLLISLLRNQAGAADAPPPWAYIADNPNYKPPIDDGSLVHVPNSTAGYTWSQLRNLFSAPIWHQGDHGALPDIVANGRRPDVYACGFCHRADGPGGPENADLAGLLKITSSGKWPTIGAAHAAPLSQAACAEAHDHAFQADH